MIGCSSLQFDSCHSYHAVAVAAALAADVVDSASEEFASIPPPTHHYPDDWLRPLAG